MAVDRRRLSPAERAARRDRVRRRAAAREVPTSTGRVLTLDAHGRSYRMWEFPGKIGACMRAGRPYEAGLLEDLYQRGLSGTAVDVGANIGNHTLWLSVVCGLQVVAFEPVRYADLAANVRLNGLTDRVRCVAVALGAETGTATHTGKGRLGDGGDIPVRRLDDYALTDVTLIKIDVEGMEPAVLAGAEHTIRRDWPIVLAEAWGPPEHAAVAAVLQPWGYRMVRQFASRVQEWRA